MNIPTEEECLALLHEAGVKEVLLDHSRRVQSVALQVADDLIKKGVSLNRNLVSAAALLHDILKLNADICHGIEGGEFLRKKGFPEVASIVEKHCLINLSDPDFVPKTTEEKIIMYADLRVNPGQIVSLDERFGYIMQRYAGNQEEILEYYAFAKQLEWELTKKV